MSWVTVAWSMIASACLTVALIYLLIWLRRRRLWEYLLLALTATGAAAMAALELLSMHAETVEAYAMVHRWGHVPVFVIVAGLTWFVRLYYGLGRTWLAHMVVGLRGLALVLNFLSPQSINYTAITGLRRVPFLGEPVSVADGILNPAIWVGELSSLLFVAFVVDASLALWRRDGEGDRRRALVIGGSIVIWVLLAAGHGFLVHRGLVHWPYLISVAFLGIVAAIAYELGASTLRDIQLTERLQMSEAELRASEQRLSLAAQAAHLGMWVWDFGGDKIWATDELYTLLGFRRDENITLASFLTRVQPEDREPVRRALERSVRDGTEYAMEYRVVMPQGELRWIAARGRSQDGRGGEQTTLLGACIDITERRRAEEAAHDLGGRLIQAQELERRRVARELHDHLGQRLALLAVELEMLSQRGHRGLTEIQPRVGALVAQLKEIGSEVHRLSYELHPARLEQLGLAAAVHGLCRELALAYEMAIDFEHDEVPSALRQDVMLCLYRIAQEALQNVVKHSGATRAAVELSMRRRALRLVITDDGGGFDPRALHNGAALGLVSMRERMRLVGGQLVIDSRPGAGTRVEARVPLSSERAVTNAALD